MLSNAFKTKPYSKTKVSHCIWQVATTVCNTKHFDQNSNSKIKNVFFHKTYNILKIVKFWDGMRCQKITLVLPEEQSQISKIISRRYHNYFILGLLSYCLIVLLSYCHTIRSVMTKHLQMSFLPLYKVVKGRLKNLFLGVLCVS